MSCKVIQTQNAPAAIGPYSQAIISGNLLFTSGQLGLKPDTGTLPAGITDQTNQSLQNIQAILDEAGFQKSDIIKTVIYLKNMADFAVVNTIYAGFFGDHKPARSCVEVSCLPKDGLIEIEVIARRGNGDQ